MVKAISVLFDRESQHSAELVEPLETLAKMGKASHAIREAIADDKDDRN